MGAHVAPTKGAARLAFAEQVNSREAGARRPRAAAVPAAWTARNPQASNAPSTRHPRPTWVNAGEADRLGHQRVGADEWAAGGRVRLDGQPVEVTAEAAAGVGAGEGGSDVQVDAGAEWQRRVADWRRPPLATRRQRGWRRTPLRPGWETSRVSRASGQCSRYMDKVIEREFFRLLSNKVFCSMRLYGEDKGLPQPAPLIYRGKSSLLKSSSRTDR
eukprot:SAG11_NODE_846_length_6884_cov_5.651732_4_plen_216_part_00